MELYILRANPPHCPPEIEQMITAHWKNFTGEANRLYAVVIAKPQESGWLRNHVLLMFDPQLFEVTTWRPDTHQIDMLVIARH